MSQTQRDRIRILTGHLAPPAQYGPTRKSARVTGNRIAIRIGPDQQHRRVVLVDHGAQLVVTNMAGEWLQVKTESGKTGWIRADFVRVGKGTVVEPKTIAHSGDGKKAS